MEAGGAGGRRQERRGNTLHSSPGLTVLDVSSSRGQIGTGMDTRPQSGRLELSGVGETGTHQSGHHGRSHRRGGGGRAIEEGAKSAPRVGQPRRGPQPGAASKHVTERSRVRAEPHATARAGAPGGRRRWWPHSLGTCWMPLTSALPRGSNGDLYVYLNTL